MQQEEVRLRFKDELNTFELITDVKEARTKTDKLDKLLNIIQPSDVVYCYTPAVFGLGVERCVKALRVLLDKGVAVRSVVYGDVTDEMLTNISLTSEIVRECFDIESYYINQSAKGAVAQRGRYFYNGRWHIGKNYLKRAPDWAFYDPQNCLHKALIHNEVSPARMWIEAKILQGAKTETIWQEYKLLCKVLGEDQWERFEKTWIANHRRELLR
jgi:hypothetical protein